MIVSEKIYSLIRNHDELTRLLPQISDITIIEYNNNDISGSLALSKYLAENDISTDVIKRIILIGRTDDQTSDRISTLCAKYPNTKVERILEDWSNTDFDKLCVYSPIVFHMAGAIENTEECNKETLRECVNKTSNAYYVCILPCSLPYGFTMEAQLRLREIEYTEQPKVSQTDFCIDKRKYIDTCHKTISSLDYFFQCISEAEHGCETCNQCSRYGERKFCPYAQRKVAECFRTGTFVSENAQIAHQWEVMASRQEYMPAYIQVADDLAEGYGCEKSETKAISIYKKYAASHNEHCIEQIIKIAERTTEGKIVALPYIASLAKNGDESMMLRISEAFQNGEYGLPKDIVQHEEWIQQGALNGNPLFMKAMAEMYEKHDDWTNAYKWYKSVREEGSIKISKEKLDEIELKMLTNGVTPEQIAQKGMNYLFGYYGVDRDTHLAYRCLKYAQKYEIPLAIGLMGQMYLKGIEVKKSPTFGMQQIRKAAKMKDLQSIECCIYSEQGIIGSEDDIRAVIDASVGQSNPIGFYLKARCLMDGLLYKKSEGVAFELMQKAAASGYPPAHFLMAKMYKDGIGNSGRIHAYQEEIRLAAEGGYYEAQGIYAVMIFDKFFVDANIVFKLLKSSIDQGYDDDTAKWRLAQCYMEGRGVPQDTEIAKPMYIAAAENGVLGAQKDLCARYLTGDVFPKNFTECARWGEAAIAQGDKSVRFRTAYASSQIGKIDRAKELYLELVNIGDSAAMNNYACSLTDPSEKAEWFQKAADAGSDYGKWNLGKLYKDGNGVEKNIDKALSLLTQSANEGCTGAMESLAKIYLTGDGVNKNGEEAIKWYLKAVNAGKNDYLLDIAFIYLKGKSVSKDVDKAIHYYKTAAEKGVKQANVCLGNIYETGKDVGMDKDKAVYFYRKAAADNIVEAKIALKRLNVNWIVDDKIEDDVNVYDDLPF